MFKEYTLSAGAKTGEDQFELPDNVPKWAVDENGCVNDYYYRVEEVLMKNPVIPLLTIIN